MENSEGMKNMDGCINEYIEQNGCKIDRVKEN